MTKAMIIVILLLNLFSSPVTWATDSTLSLTTTDGTGLALRRLEARVVLDGFLAFTELELVFYNPENRRREGHFQIVLPDNAAMSRFAMKIGEQLQEGEVVEKQLARRAYEDFLHRRQDPALLEIDSGNRFNARIFPIEPQSEKVLLLSYSQRLREDYILPLKGLPTLQELSIKVFYDNATFNPEKTQLGTLEATVAKREVLTVDKRDYRPTEDFRMPYQPRHTGNLAMQNEQLIAAKVVPFTETTATPVPLAMDNLIVLLDTSASQSPFFTDTLKRLATLLPQLQVKTLQLYTFDQEVQKVGAAITVTEQQQLLQSLQNYPILGASRLDTIVVDALSPLKLSPSRLLLVSDAVMTAGETSPTALLKQLKTLPWLTRLDILLPSYHSDATLANALAKAGQTAGIVASLQLTDSQLVHQLTSPVYADIPITIDGAKWFWPTQVERLQTNEPLIIFAELNPDQHDIAIRIADKNLTVTPQSANPILLKREWARARIDKLLQLEDTATDADLRSAFHNEITNLSVKERVLSPYTALLVLETEADYQRYQIDRRGLADILTVGIDGLTAIKRSGRDNNVVPPLPPIIENRPMPLAQEKTRPSTRNGIVTPPTAVMKAAPPSSPLSTGEKKLDQDKKVEEPAKPIDESKAKSQIPSMEGMASVGGKAESSRESQMPSLPGMVSVEGKEEAQVSETTPLPATSAPADAIRANTLPAEAAAAPTPSPVEEQLDGEADIAPAPALRIAPAAPSPENENTSATVSRAERRDPRTERDAIDDATDRGGLENHIDAAATVSWTGHYAEFRTLLDRGEIKAAGKLVQEWRQADLADVMALIAWGEWAEKSDNLTQAARAYGSLIDYFPARADIRRWAAERLLATKTASWLSIDSLKTAVTQRPDHPSGHYLLAMAYWDAGQFKAAIETLQAALQRQFNPRFAQITRILEETLALLLTTLSDRQELGAIWTGQSLHWEKVSQPQLRFVLMWETDANDVDFHIYDGKQNHAFYSQPTLATGGNLYADITTGYGPECFSISSPSAFPYKIQANYYSMGPMGYGMGIVHLLRYQPKQGLISEYRPFVVMQTGATVELGEVK